MKLPALVLVSVAGLGACVLAALPALATPLNCAGATALTCNQTVSGTTVGGPSLGASYPCGGPVDYSGPERVYTFNNPVAQVVSFVVGNAAPELDVVLLDATPPPGCDTDACVDLGNRHVISYALPAGDYYVVVDGRSGAQGTFDLSVVCGVVAVPSTINVTLDPNDANPANDCAHEDKRLWLNPDPFEADVVFAIDTTASQSAAIANLRIWGRAILARLNATIDDVRFALVSYKDYPASFSSCGYSASYGSGSDYPYRLEVGMTNNINALSAALATLTAGGGDDLPESMTRVFYESYADPAVGFRPGAAHAVINLTDIVPHDCDISRCNGVGIRGFNNHGIDPGRDAIVGTADDLEILPTLNQMAARGTFLFNIYTGLPDAQTPELLALWNCWTGLTGGQGFDSNPALDTDAVADAITATIRNQVTHCNVLKMTGSVGYDTWIVNLTPPTRTGVDLPGQLDFSLDICPPVGTTPGPNDFTVDVLCDQLKLTQQVVHVDIPGAGCTPNVVAQVNPAQACAGVPVQLSGAGSTVPGCSSLLEYRWRGSNGFLRDWNVNPDASDTPLFDTSYILDVRCLNPSCQRSSTPFPVVLHPSPVASAGPNVDLCRNNTVTIGGSPTGSGGTPPLSFSWAATPANPSMSCTSGPTCGNPSVSPAVNTTYTVTVTDATGCVATSSTTVSVFTPPAPADVGNSLRAVRAKLETPPDPTSMIVTWADVGGSAVTYNLRSADLKRFTGSVIVLGGVAPGFGVRLGGEVTGPPLLRFYRASASNCARIEGPF